MTQLELPPISFARYLDLLKRRRWQVLPVSVLGLVIGAVIALLIPRYYVAKTRIEFRGAVLDVERGREDPMADLIDSAQISIPWVLADALDRLKWPEALVADPNQRRQVEDEIRKRIEITDLNPKKSRLVANVEVAYKDVDGHRAKELADALAQTWIDKQSRELAAAAQREMSDMRRGIDHATKARDATERQMTEFFQAHRLVPQDLLGRREQEGDVSPLSRSRLDAETRIATLVEALDGLQAQLEQRRGELARAPLTGAAPLPTTYPPEAMMGLAFLTQQLEWANRALANAKESHRNYEQYKAQRDDVAKMLAALKEFLGAGQGEVENAERKQLAAAVADLETQIKAKETTLKREREQLAALDREIAALPRVHEDWRALVAERERHEASLDALVQQERVLEERQKVLMREDAYRISVFAEVPPRPTEPNVTLVALAGGAVGLAFAIGLVLLIDALQSTFKTVDDVERALALPILGQLSHLTTEQQRRQRTARRTRTAVIAGAFVVLMLSLVTIYYVAPTRLPALVRGAFELLLGTPAAPGAPR